LQLKINNKAAIANGKYLLEFEVSNNTSSSSSFIEPPATGHHRRWSGAKRFFQNIFNNLLRWGEAIHEHVRVKKFPL
jgi:hypothetical protein